ncbi:hypothetical protein FDECE_2562 [Fusarium decemcellulare]|nr:hypothetical protein FDECE_2562 [Fusarium decemcellulare]
MSPENSDVLPPGTQRLNDLQATHILLAPQPSSDPNQPLNWSSRRKVLHVFILSLYSLMMFAIPCMSIPFWQNFNEELGMSYDTLNNGYAANMAGLSIGCIIFIPIALRIGRRPVYLVTALIMFACGAWQAEIYTVGDMVGMNVVAGIAGAVNEALFQVTVSDIFFVHQRGSVNGIYLIMILIGNYVAPVYGGQVAMSMGWRWACWSCTVAMGVIVLLMFFFLEESKYVPPPLDGHDITAATTPSDNNPLNKTTSVAKPNLPSDICNSEESVLAQRSRLVEVDTSLPMKSYRIRHALWTLDKSHTRTVWKDLYEPFQILATFPAVMFAALQYGWSVAMLSILAITQSSLYSLPPYNFSTAGIGNMNIPPLVGAILGTLFGGPFVDYMIVQIAKRRGGIYEPETRLWLFLLPGLSMTIGCLVYGLTISQGMPWVINAVGAGFIGFSIGGCGDIALTYVQDSYHFIIGPALTSVVFVRNVLATVLVFAATPWMEGMGVYNMFVVMGCIATAVALTCVPLIVWGRKFRIQLADNSMARTGEGTAAK